MVEFKNGTDLNFVDINSEEFRIYVYDNGFEYRINDPLKLHVSSAGGHRVFDSSGHSHYVAKGWRVVKWKAREGQPHFVK